MFFSLNAMEQMDLTDRLALVCIPILLILIALVLPKKKGFSVVTRVLMIALMTLVAAFRLVQPLADLVGISTRQSFIPVLLLAEALFLLWGLFFRDAYLTQGLYGLMCGVSFTAGILGFVFPTWLSAATFADVAFSAEALLDVAQYAALVFVPAFLVVSDLYRLRLSSAWHVLFGAAFFGSLLLTLVKADIVASPAYDTLLAILPDLKAFTFGMDAVKECGIFLAAALLVSLLCGLVATIIRRVFARSGERFAASETRGALFTRLIGRVFSAIGSVALLVATPALVSLLGITGTAATLFCLLPIVWMLLIQLFVEFAAEDAEIRHAQAALANA